MVDDAAAQVGRDAGPPLKWCTATSGSLRGRSLGLRWLPRSRAMSEDASTILRGSPRRSRWVRKPASG